MRNISLLFSVLLLFSCNNANESENHQPLQTETLKRKLLAKADSLYLADQFLQAIPLYDSLIAMDSIRGGYYFKRGYCKSMLLETTFDEQAISDYKKSIELNYIKKESSFLNIGVIFRFYGMYD